jgi:signal peptide peptidase SppA
MKLLDVITSPWAVLPDQLREIQNIYSTHLRGDKIDIAAIEARMGRPLASDQQAYEIRSGTSVAVLTLDGVMAPKANLMMQISGGVSTQMAGTQIESAMADPRVTALVLAIDSPGGSVFGTPELAATVHELSKIKPIVTVCDATLASAAYWVGSAANAVFITGPTVQVGSIGVVASHNYDPRANNTTEITAGKYKRIASGTAPLTDEGKAYMQGQVDHLYSVFVDTVATQRGTTPAAVLEHMADGRVFIGQQAVDRGLVDGFATVDQIVAQLAADPAKFAKRRKATFASATVTPSAKPAGALASTPTPTEPVLLTPDDKPNLGTTPMDRETLAQQHPALLAQLQAEFSASATATGAANERTRIAAVRSQVLPGHEALIEGLAFDGKTTGPEAAMAVLAAEKKARTAQAQALASDAPQPLPLLPSATVETTQPSKPNTPATRADLDTQAKAYMAANPGISYIAAVKHIQPGA